MTKINRGVGKPIDSKRTLKRLAKIDKYLSQNEEARKKISDKLKKTLTLTREMILAWRWSTIIQANMLHMPDPNTPEDQKSILYKEYRDLSREASNWKLTQMEQDYIDRQMTDYMEYYAGIDLLSEQEKAMISHEVAHLTISSQNLRKNLNIEDVWYSKTIREIKNIDIKEKDINEWLKKKESLDADSGAKFFYYGWYSNMDRPYKKLILDSISKWRQITSIWLQLSELWPRLVFQYSDWWSKDFIEIQTDATKNFQNQFAHWQPANSYNKDMFLNEAIMFMNFVKYKSDQRKNNSKLIN